MLLLTYKHVICCLPTNMLFVADLHRCYLLLTYKHFICCWPTNMIFVADLHRCCLLLIYKHVICCWPTNMLFLLTYTRYLLLTYKHVICCWPSIQMLFVADLHIEISVVRFWWGYRVQFLPGFLVCSYQTKYIYSITSLYSVNGKAYVDRTMSFCCFKNYRSSRPSYMTEA